jgi:hypothetical protein
LFVFHKSLLSDVWEGGSVDFSVLSATCETIMYSILRFSLAVVLWAQLSISNPIDTGALGTPIASRADTSLVGYLGAFFLGADPYVYFYLSNGNNAVSFKALNKGQPVIKPTKGTGGVRDPAIVQGGGSEAGKKWYIVGTDLDIGKVGKQHRSTLFMWRSKLMIGNRQLGMLLRELDRAAYSYGRAPTWSTGPTRGW